MVESVYRIHPFFAFLRMIIHHFIPLQVIKASVAFEQAQITQSGKRLQPCGHIFIPFHQNRIYGKVGTETGNLMFLCQLGYLHRHAQCFGNRFQGNGPVSHLNPFQRVLIRMRCFVGHQPHRNIGNIAFHLFGKRFLYNGYPVVRPDFLCIVQ